MEYSKEQVKAAYALNLCTVSVSQIIDYDDINIMEQEYEGILNNLNLEQMPKDEALLKIIKQILDTITFFRIQEGDKKFIEKKYQQKMKNAIWSAVPNIGLIIASGDPIVMAVSLASQVGMGYMNYRKAKAENNVELEIEQWQLERTAIDQFNGLRRELFDTAWRLSAAYQFPDQLRLTERQIKQYNAILMDNDLIRRYGRLNTIKDYFIAYPPFWYYFGNSANAIAGSNLRISDETRQLYRHKAKEHFLQFRESNQQGLQREDPVAAACALELVDLLDFQKDSQLIAQLLDEAIRYSGRANDVLQLAAITYLRLNDHSHAAALFSQLVNEQYNTVLNAQLLSCIYVSELIKTKDTAIESRYEILSQQVGADYLYPLPQADMCSARELENCFVMMQRQVLHQKYQSTMDNFFRKYSALFDKLIPLEVTDDRKYELGKIFSNRQKADEYRGLLRNSNITYGLFDLLNQMFEACCGLDFMTEPTKERLLKCIKDAILENKDCINDLHSRLENDQFDYFDMEKLLKLNLLSFSQSFFGCMRDVIDAYVSSRHEMQDFAIAEQNLAEFCVREQLPEPSADNTKEIGTDEESLLSHEKLFTPQLLSDASEECEAPVSHTQEMIELIERFSNSVIKSEESAEVFVIGDPRIERYFRNHPKLQKSAELTSNTIAVLDNKALRFDFDLIFTEYGIIPIKNGAPKAPVAYDAVKMENGKISYLTIDGHFESSGVDLEVLRDLISELASYAKHPPVSSSPFAIPNLTNPFKKK